MKIKTVRIGRFIGQVKNKPVKRRLRMYTDLILDPNYKPYDPGLALLIFMGSIEITLFSAAVYVIYSAFTR